MSKWIELTIFAYMIPYNTDNEKLRLPEFGRTIQTLIEYCVHLEDREERNNCAYAIADVMANLFPELIGDDNDMSKIWDQMQIMSGCSLDVDAPYELITAEAINPKPDRIPYSAGHIALRHYGKYVEKMIPVIADMEEGPERDDLILTMANHMKKVMQLNNKEGVDDARILRDLAFFSGGKISLDPEQYYLCDFKETPQAQQSKKKHKK